MISVAAHEALVLLDNSRIHVVKNLDFSFKVSSEVNRYLGAGFAQVTKNGPWQAAGSFDCILNAADTFLTKFLANTPFNFSFATQGESTGIKVQNCYVTSLRYSFSVGQIGKVSVSYVSYDDFDDYVVGSFTSPSFVALNSHIGTISAEFGISDAVIKSFNLDLERNLIAVYPCFGMGLPTINGGNVSVSTQCNIEAGNYSLRDFANRKTLENLNFSLTANSDEETPTTLLSFTCNNMKKVTESFASSENDTVNINVEYKGFR
jgi:hypothetical protein